MKLLSSYDNYFPSENQVQKNPFEKNYFKNRNYSDNINYISNTNLDMKWKNKINSNTKNGKNENQEKNFNNFSKTVSEFTNTYKTKEDKLNKNNEEENQEKSNQIRLHRNSVQPSEFIIQENGINPNKKSKILNFSNTTSVFNFKKNDLKFRGK